MQRNSEWRHGSAPDETGAPLPAGAMKLIMPYHVYTRTGPGAFGVIVETVRSQAVAKKAQPVHDGHDVQIKDLLGNR